MRNRYLFFFITAILSLIVFIFFFFSTQPIPVPIRKIISSDSNQTTKPTVTFVDPIFGPKDAKVTIIEYGDFECGPCKQLQSNIETAMAGHTNDVRFVWKDMPNDSVHPNATNASIAAQCANRQGQFWGFARALFDRQTFLADSQYEQIATDLKLNLNDFSNCFTKKETLPIVQKNFNEGKALGIVATPTLFIGDKQYVGVQSLEDINSAISEQLNTQTNVPTK